MQNFGGSTRWVVGVTHFTALQADQLQGNQLIVTNVITDTTLTADNCGTYITNAGAVLTPTLTLPALSTASNCALCLHTATAQLWYLDPVRHRPHRRPHRHQRRQAQQRHRRQLHLSPGQRVNHLVRRALRRHLDRRQLTPP